MSQQTSDVDLSLEEKVFSLARNVFLAAGIYSQEDLAQAVTGDVPTPGTSTFYPPAETGAPSRVDRRGLYKLFELASALHFRVLPWECVPPEVLVAAGARRNKNNGALPDYGVDCASSDLKTQLQAKWYRPGGRIPFTAVGTFGMYAEHLGAGERILVSSPGVKFSYPAGDIRSIRYETLAPETVVELLAPALDGVAAIQAAGVPSQTNRTTLHQLETKSERKLRPYQEEALEKIHGACLAGGVHSVVMACGTGKTVIVAQLVATMLSGVQRGANSCRLAILIPSLQLISRFTAELAIWAPGVEYEVIKGGVDPTFEKPFLICVNNSARKISNYHFEVVVVDEAHHVQGWDYLEQEEDVSDDNESESLFEDDSDSETSLEDESETSFEDDDEDLFQDDSEVESSSEATSPTSTSSETTSPSSTSTSPSSKTGFLRVASRLKCRTRLDFTATPKSEKAPCVALGLREAIEAGILVDYWIDVPVFENQDSAEQKAANRKPNLARLVAEHPEWKKVLAYCNTVAEAEIFAGLLCERGVPAVSFSGKTPIVERERLIQRFEAGEFRALVTVNVLGEGVDIPCADCCLFVEPRGSRINVIQCIGRVLRKFPGKNRSVVVLPTTEDEEHAVLRRFFAIILDEDREYRKWRDSVEGGSNSRGRVELNFSLGEESIETLQLMKEDAILLREDIFSRLGETFFDVWMAKFHILREFVAEHSRFPGKNEKFHAQNISSWCCTQRILRKKGKLRADREKLLESIPFWNWSKEKEGTSDEIWLRKFKVMEIFIAERSRMPKNREKFKGENVGDWRGVQQKARKLGKLSDDRISLLEGIPLWKWSKVKEGTREDIWFRSFRSFQDFVLENSRLPKNNEKQGEEKVGLWLMGQRRKLRNGRLSKERKALLEGVPFWDWGEERKGTPDEIWLDNFLVFQEFISEHSRLPKATEKFRGYDVGGWRQKNRKDRKKGKLSVEREEMLESIPLWEWGKKGTVEESWSENFILLQDFISEYSRVPMVKENFKETPLGGWCSTQRKIRKKGILNPKREALLNSIPLWRWTK